MSLLCRSHLHTADHCGMLGWADRHELFESSVKELKRFCDSGEKGCGGSRSAAAHRSCPVAGEPCSCGYACTVTEMVEKVMARACLRASEELTAQVPISAIVQMYVSACR